MKLIQFGTALGDMTPDTTAALDRALAEYGQQPSAPKAEPPAPLTVPAKGSANWSKPPAGVPEKDWNVYMATMTAIRQGRAADVSMTWWNTAMGVAKKTGNRPFQKEISDSFFATKKAKEAASAPPKTKKEEKEKSPIQEPPKAPPPPPERRYAGPESKRKPSQAASKPAGDVPAGVTKDQWAAYQATGDKIRKKVIPPTDELQAALVIAKKIGQQRSVTTINKLIVLNDLGISSAQMLQYVDAVTSLRSGTVPDKLVLTNAAGVATALQDKPSVLGYVPAKVTGPEWAAYLDALSRASKDTPVEELQMVADTAAKAGHAKMAAAARKHVAERTASASKPTVAKPPATPKLAAQSKPATQPKPAVPPKTSAPSDRLLSQISPALRKSAASPPSGIDLDDWRRALVTVSQGTKASPVDVSAARKIMQQAGWGKTDAKLAALEKTRGTLPQVAAAAKTTTSATQQKKPPVAAATPPAAKKTAAPIAAKAPRKLEAHTTISDIRVVEAKRNAHIATAKAADQVAKDQAKVAAAAEEKRKAAEKLAKTAKDDEARKRATAAAAEADAQKKVALQKAATAAQVREAQTAHAVAEDKNIKAAPAPLRREIAASPAPLPRVDQDEVLTTPAWREPPFPRQPNRQSEPPRAPSPAAVATAPWQVPQADVSRAAGAYDVPPAEVAQKISAARRGDATARRQLQAAASQVHAATDGDQAARDDIQSTLTSEDPGMKDKAIALAAASAVTAAGVTAIAKKTPSPPKKEEETAPTEAPLKAQIAPGGSSSAAGTAVVGLALVGFGILAMSKKRKSKP